MKRLSLLAVIILALLLVACGGNEDVTSDSLIGTDSIIDSVPSLDSVPTLDSTPAIDSVPNSTPSIDSQVSSAPTQDSIADSQVADSTVDSAIDSIIDSTIDSTVDSTEPEPSLPFDIAKDGEQRCSIIYDGSDIRAMEFALNLSSYIKEAFGISLSVESDEDTVVSKDQYKVLIGNVKDSEEIKEAKKAVALRNDFTMRVVGKSYVMYATNSRLYEYIFQLIKNEDTVGLSQGSWRVDPVNDFTYQESQLKSTSYMDYYISKNGGELTQDILLSFFEKRELTATDGTTLPYRIYIPYNYNPRKDYPVLTILHGAGERGNDNTSQMVHLVLNIFKGENTPLWDAIVICPQCPKEQQWVDTPWANGNYLTSRVEESNENKAVLEILDFVADEFSTDSNRYYLTGLSMGGFGVWDLLMRHPEKFAGAVPLCGGADILMAITLKDKPIYTIHGSKDDVVPADGTRNMVKYLLEAGSTVVNYEELSGYGHNVWDYASKKASIWTWLFEQTLQS